MKRGKEKSSEGPLVSIVCTNYNKGTWIRDAIEGFLQQETDFPYEILIIDDSSSDNSPDIIKEFAENYPDKIRAFYNTKNLGITKTWIKVCKEANGKYIARCDGDDYWVDNEKLKKQVALLESSQGSLWCSTDFDIILPDGTKTHTSALENGIMVRATSYENLLATKGFTMASTWVVATNLMLEVNDAIDTGAIDDTFNIQLELFYRTKLTYLPEATTVYRVGHESDSHPADTIKAKQRNDRLLETQLEYIDKYRDKVDFVELSKQSMTASTNLEAMLLDERSNLLQANITIRQQQELLDELDSRIKEIQDSKRYKLAGAMAYPMAYLKRVKGRFR